MRIQKLLDTIIRLRQTSQTELSEAIGLNRSVMNRFLNAETDIRSSALIQILDSLDIRLDTILESEIDRLLDRKKFGSTGEALETLIKGIDPFIARTIVDTLLKQAKQTKNPTLGNALAITNDLRSELKLMRRRV